jgi:hypothetical protein
MDKWRLKHPHDPALPIPAVTKPEDFGLVAIISLDTFFSAPDYP